MVSSTQRKRGGLNQLVSSTPRKRVGLNQLVSLTPRKKEGLTSRLAQPREKERGLLSPSLLKGSILLKLVLRGLKGVRIFHCSRSPPMPELAENTSKSTSCDTVPDTHILPDFTGKPYGNLHHRQFYNHRIHGKNSNCYFSWHP